MPRSSNPHGYNYCTHCCGGEPMLRVVDKSPPKYGLVAYRCRRCGREGAPADPHPLADGDRAERVAGMQWEYAMRHSK